MVASEQVLVTGQQLDTLCINTIRTLAIDAVQQANSGHPGAPMGLAPVTYCLWQEFLRYDPADPTWLNRDRFVLSNGHASMLLYAMLHLAEVRQVDKHGQVLKELAVPMEEIKRFRQLGSRTPGHPESHLTSGVETTTGPLGQGVGNSVGMAIAGKWLAANFNRPGLEIFDYNVYAMCSDGDLMEGIGGEAASLAGHLKLSNLCWMYDHNHITLDGPASWSFSEDVATRFVGYGWNVTRVADANDLEMLARAFETFHNTTDRPTLIIVDSHIGYGSPHKHDSNAAHGEPLGEEEVRLTKKFYGWPEDAKFLVPDGVREHFREGIGKRGHDLHAQWSQRFAEYSQKFPDLAERLALHAAPRTACGMGQEPADLSRGCQGHRDSREFRQGAQRAGAKHSVADRRIGRSGDFEQDHAEIRRRGRFSGRHSRRTQPALRGARARDGRERKRDDRVGHSGIRRDVL